MDSSARIILVDSSDASREVLARRLSAQGYKVEPVGDPATGADMALSSPPAAVIADLWMPTISGVQLCRLLRAEPATADVPVILRGDRDDPRSRFWAERAGAAAYVPKGRMGELVRALTRSVAEHPTDDNFFMQLSGGGTDIRDRIARHLDAALFDSVIAGEVRALASCGSFDRLFDLFSQVLSQIIGYRWLALSTANPSHFAMHNHPTLSAETEIEARTALALPASLPLIRVEDDDARAEPAASAPVVMEIAFGGQPVGKIAVGLSESVEGNPRELLALVAREIGGPLRMTALMEESHRLASVDPLTNLMNRRALIASMGVELQRAQRYAVSLSVLLLDVDHFKAINDRHGHAGGDLVLSRLGAELKNSLRTPDLVARWGGEEFVIVLTHTGNEGGQVVAERIRRSVECMNVTDAQGTLIPVTVSIGLATLSNGERLEQLIDRSDRAMYSAKMGGRNRVGIAATPSVQSPTASVRDPVAQVSDLAPPSHLTDVTPSTN